MQQDSNFLNFIKKINNKTVNDLLAEYRTNPEKTFQQTYNIKLNKDGSVFDITRKVCYNNLNDWAESSINHQT